jgi:hypothetical protein
MSVDNTPPELQKFIRRAMTKYTISKMMGEPPYNVIIKMPPSETTENSVSYANAGYNSDDGRIINIDDMTSIHMEFLYEEYPPIVDRPKTYKYNIHNIYFILIIYPSGVAELQGLKKISLKPVPSEINDATTLLEYGSKILKHACATSKKHGAKIIVLSDNSYIDNDYPYRTDLLMIDFLSTGDTWFSKVKPHFKPYYTIGGYAKFILQREKVLTNKWSDIAPCLKFDLPVDISDIDSNAEGSAMKVFSRIREQAVDFFIENEGVFTIASKIDDITRCTWYRLFSKNIF